MYTASNEGYVKAFKAAKLYLSTYAGQGNYVRNFICYALEAAMIDNKIEYNDYIVAKALIRERMGQYHHGGTLEGWLERFHPELAAEILEDERNRCRRMQATRHAWVDSLIEEFSK